MYRKISFKWLLVLIILLGAFLRLVDLSGNPKSLYGDELTLVYDTYSILHTGHDSTGALHPLTFAMGAGRPGGYIYFSTPFVALFGPTALGVRGLSAFSGIAIIFLMFLLGEELFSKEVGLLAAFLTAVSPWDIELSRAGFEAHFALFLSLLGILLFLWANKKPVLYIISALMFAITIHTYPTFKLTLPLFFIPLIWFTGGYKKLLLPKVRNYVFAAVAIIALGGILALYQTKTAGSEQRFSNLNLFGQTNIQQIVAQNNNLDRFVENDSPLSLIFHNKFIENTLMLGDSYLKNLSADFLFLHGDREPVHNPATMGEFYWAEIALLLLGMIFLFKRIDNRRLFWFLIFWIVVTPVATSFLLDPHALRNDFMLPPLIILCSVGMIYLINSLQKPKVKFILYSLVVLFIIQFVFFIERVYFLAPDLYERFWSYPAKQVSQMVLSQKANYDYVIVSSRVDNVEFAYPVYGGIDPNLVINQSRQPAKLGQYDFKKFDNVYIGSLPDSRLQNFLNNLSGKVLYIGSPFETKDLAQYKVVTEKDNTTGFIYTP